RSRSPWNICGGRLSVCVTEVARSPGCATLSVRARDPGATFDVPTVASARLIEPLAASLARFLFSGRFLFGALMVVSPSRRLSVHLGVVSLITASQASFSIAQARA